MPSLLFMFSIHLNPAPSFEPIFVYRGHRGVISSEFQDLLRHFENREKPADKVRSSLILRRPRSFAAPSLL